MRIEWRYLMALRSVTSLLLGFSLAAAGSAAAQAQQDAAANPAPAPAQPAAPPAAQPAPAQPAPATTGSVFVVPAGTKIPLTLRSALSTKTAKPGDAVYLASSFPVVVGSRVVIPAGVFVQGYIDGLQRGGKVKGRAQLMMHFVSMAFPNGVVIALPGAVDKVPGATGADVKDKEGLIEAQSTKGADAKTVGTTALTGATVGGLAGYATDSPGLGTGIGAGVGAAAGMLAVMMKHGQDIVFPEGTTVVMVMQRPLQVQEQQLAGMGNLTGYDGPQMTPVNAEQLPLPKPKPPIQTN
jgi:type IV secretion system protein VirB10